MCEVMCVGHPCEQLRPAGPDHGGRAVRGVGIERGFGDIPDPVRATAAGRRDGEAPQPAGVVEDVDHAGVGQAGHAQVGDAAQGDLVVERIGEQRPGLGEKPERLLRPLPLGEVVDEREEAEDGTVLPLVGHVGGGDHAALPRLEEHLGLVRHPLATQRPLDKGADRGVAAADHLLHPPAEHLPARTAEPLPVCSIEIEISLVRVDIGDQHGHRVGDQPQPLQVETRGCLLRTMPGQIAEGRGLDRMRRCGHVLARLAVR
jgi:hypothetical protein